MRFGFLARCLLVAGVLAAPAAQAAGAGEITLVAQPALGPGLAAFPRIAAPEGPQARRIDQALAAADARLRKAAGECHAAAVAAQADPKDAGWQRTVAVAMRGPRYLALVASDAWFCGGAYPSEASFALAYDLQTGAPMNWERLLPKALIHTVALDTAGDGTRLGVVASPTLQALYLRAVKPGADCAEALRDDGLQFILWPNAAEDGIALEPSGLPHAWAACGDVGVLGLPVLRKLGVDPAVLDAIAAGHRFTPTH